MTRGTGVSVIERYEGVLTHEILISKLSAALTSVETAQAVEAARIESITADRQLRLDQEREYADTVAADRERLRLEEERKKEEARLEQERKDKEELQAAITLSSQLSNDLDIERKKKAIKEEPKAGPGNRNFILLFNVLTLF